MVMRLGLVTFDLRKGLGCESVGSSFESVVLRCAALEILTVGSVPLSQGVPLRIEGDGAAGWLAWEPPEKVQCARGRM